MAIVSGKSGTVVFSGGYTTGVRSFTVDITSEDVDTTALGDKWQTRFGGVNGFSGSFEAQLDASSISQTSGTNDPTLDELKLGGTAAEAKFVFDEDTSATGGMLRGSIVITGISARAQQQGGSSTITFTFNGSGALNTTAS